MCLVNITPSAPCVPPSSAGLSKADQLPPGVNARRVAVVHLPQRPVLAVSNADPRSRHPEALCSSWTAHLSAALQPRDAPVRHRREVGATVVVRRQWRQCLRSRHEPPAEPSDGDHPVLARLHRLEPPGAAELVDVGRLDAQEPHHLSAGARPDLSALDRALSVGNPRVVSRFRVGVDIGGTFTDIVLLDAGGAIHTKKVSSSVDDYARAIVEGLDEVFRETGLAGARLRRGAARHHRRVERDPGAEGRAHRAHHHEGLPRRARDPAYPDAEALRPLVGEAGHARRALSPPRGRRAHRRARTCRDAARSRGGRARAGSAARREDRGARRVPASIPTRTPRTRSRSRRSCGGRRRSSRCR